MDNIISGNLCYADGGGIYCYYHASPKILNNIIAGNTASFNYGGGIYCEYYASPVIANNLITENNCAYGSGIRCESYASPTIVNTTITRNYASISAGGFSCTASCFPTISNSILWDNTPDEVVGNPTIAYSDILGGYPGTANINQNPLFIQGPLGYYYLKQIQAGQNQDSPCVDAGDHTVGEYFRTLYSVHGTTRIDLVLDAGMIDMGYHYPLRGIGFDSGLELEAIDVFELHPAQ